MLSNCSTVGLCGGAVAEPKLAGERPPSAPSVQQLRATAGESGKSNFEQEASAATPTVKAPSLASVPLSSVAVTRALLQMDETELADMFREVLQARPALVSRLNLQPRPEKSEEILTEQEDKAPDFAEKEDFDDSHAHVTAADLGICPLPPFESLLKPTLPMLQFTTNMFYAHEAKGYVQVDLVRVGPDALINSMAAAVNWATADGSAKAGHKYVAASGRAEFPQGEAYACIRVEMLHSTHWNPTLDFHVELKEAGVKNLELHRYHMKCRVKIVDDGDTFPTSRFKEQLQKDLVEEIDPEMLMQEYFKMNLLDPTVRRGSIKIALNDLSHNIVFMARLVLKVWMINQLFMPVLSGKQEWDVAKSTLLMMIAIGGFIIPEHLLHFIDYRQNFWGVAGGSRKVLQANLMRKYMSYSATVREGINHGEVILILYKHMPDLVKEAYGGIFQVTKQLTLLVCLLLYLTIGTRAMGLKIGELQWMAMNTGLFCLFPIVMYTGLKLRSRKSNRLMSLVHGAELACSNHTMDMLNNFELLEDYGNRGAAVTKFERCIDEYNKATANHKACEDNNEFIPASLTITVCTVWIIFGGILTMNGTIALGTYLANWSVIEQIGKSWQDIYKHVLEIEGCMLDLRIIVRLMNYPTDIARSSEITDQSHQKGREMAETLIDAKTPDETVLDKLPIELYGIEHSFGSKKIFSNLSTVMHQGGLHVVCGHRASGKTTLLKLLGSKILPQRNEGFLFVPQHLRILHVSKEPLFFRGTLLENLTYGVLHGNKDGRLERVLKIVKGFELDAHVLEQISDKEDAKVDCWNDVIARSDLHLLNIVRGLIASPEVMILHKPTWGLGPRTVPVVFKMLKTFVSHRGVEQDLNRYLLRRPRTCIFSFTMQADLMYADVVHNDFEDHPRHISKLMP